MRFAFCVAVSLLTLGPSRALAADCEFYGRTGDGIEIDLGSLPGVPAGATFSGLNIGNFFTHNVFTSNALDQGDFASDGRLWLFANPNTFGDTNPEARGFQGTLQGSVEVNGEPKTFSVTVQPGHTGVGAGSVPFGFERAGRPANNRLNVARQQQRLRYFGFRRQGGSPINVTGTFDFTTDQALQTFQAAVDGGVNATQANSADGIIGPITASWLNAANAPTWDELIDPDPQAPGTFSVSRMIGNFDLWPGGDRSGTTPQPERFGTSWAIDVFEKGSALAKAATGRTQLMTGMSTRDGYGSSAFHSTHQAGMDVDVDVPSAAENFGNGIVSSEEQKIIDHALGFINAPSVAGVARVLTSNRDIRDGINAQAPGIGAYDSSGGHLSHLHIDIAKPDRVNGLANLPGDFNLDGNVDALDYTVWRDGLNQTRLPSEFAAWQSAFGTSQAAPSGATTVPEPSALLGTVLLVAFGVARHR
ncbi:MAG: peptidoglycan-binding domain-containing protein [Planctomycetota bacterium]